jgi:hypothetical protein
MVGNNFFAIRGPPGLHFEPPFRGVVDFADSDSAAKAVYSFTSLPPAIQIAWMYGPVPIVHPFPFGFAGQPLLPPPLPLTGIDDCLAEVLANASETVNPRQLGFIPVSPRVGQV